MMFLNAQKPGLIKDPYIYKPDSIMLDLEDAVAENQKDAARFSLYHALKTINYRGCERVVRINGLDTPYWKEDIRCAVAGGCDAIRIPKTESALDAAKLAKTHYGIRCMVMPYVTAGSQNPGQRELDFCIHYRYETQKAILSDLVASLYAQGYRKMVIINGHGGNTFKSMIRDLSLDYPDFLIASSEWFAFIPAKEYFDEPGDHADELETSVMMHYHPELVNLDEAGDGNYKKFASQMLNEKVAWIPRNWQNVSQDTGIGNPKKASAGKGKKYAEAVVAKYALLFEELVHKELY